mmetsp:Transcript_10778/g.22964  ORF Transcript_10778/g.22964 Transcript_10778/m.22964 type:complete len:80 (+) Transcript_10778:218-457(+)
MALQRGANSRILARTHHATCDAIRYGVVSESSGPGEWMAQNQSSSSSIHSFVKQSSNRLPMNELWLAGRGSTGLDDSIR